jgi:outer membrane protein OmpA-like peptidoglycan-associated protein
MPSRTAAVRSLAFAVAAFGSVVAAAQAAPQPAASKSAGPDTTAPSPPAAAESTPAGAPTATVSFDRQSVEIKPAARSALDTVAQVMTAQGVRQVELHGYATGDDPDDARKLALVRTLMVRMYLVDQGVKARIEVAAQSAPAKGGGNERVDIMTP